VTRDARKQIEIQVQILEIYYYIDNNNLMAVEIRFYRCPRPRTRCSRWRWHRPPRPSRRQCPR